MNLDTYYDRKTQLEYNTAWFYGIPGGRGRQYAEDRRKRMQVNNMNYLEMCSPRCNLSATQRRTTMIEFSLDTRKTDHDDIINKSLEKKCFFVVIFHKEVSM